MTDTPTIPYGYKQTQGQLQKGDAIWNGEKFVRVKKCYPNADGLVPVFAIRRCEVVQETLPGVEAEKCSVCGGAEPCSHDFDKEGEQLEEIGRTMGTAIVQPEPIATETVPVATEAPPARNEPADDEGWFP